MNNNYKVQYFRRFTVLLFNTDTPIYILKQVIGITVSKRPQTQLYIEVETSNIKIIEILREYRFKEGEEYLHVHRSDWTGFMIPPESLSNWIIPKQK